MVYKRPRNRKAYMKEYCKVNREEIKIKRRERYLAKREKELAAVMLYHAKNSGKIREYSKKYYYNNAETIKLKAREVRLEHPERHREGIKKYRQNHPEYVIKQLKRLDKWKKEHPEAVKAGSKVHKANYRALMKAANICAAADMKLLRLIYLNCPAGYHVDHITPLSKNGAHHPDNLQYLPAIINMQKQNNLNFDCSSHAIRWQSLIEKKKIGEEIEKKEISISTES